MRSYDAQCPVCGTRNSGLFLDETEGWMECRACRSIVNVKKEAVPCPPSETENPAAEKCLDKVIFSTVIISEKRYNHHDHQVFH